MKSLAALLACVALGPLHPILAQENKAPAAPAANMITLRGSSVVARAMAGAVEGLKKEHDIGLSFVQEANGLEMIERLSTDVKDRDNNNQQDSVIDVALFTRPMTGQEHAMSADRKFTETLIGKQAVFVVVPEQVWKSGVHALTRQQFRDIYEGELTNWKKVGGEDRTIMYYNREAGRGIWDVYMMYLYGSVSKAPIYKDPPLNNASDVVTAVEFNVAAISLLEYGEFQGTRLRALGLKLDDGTVIEPTLENISNGKYPLARPLNVVTGRHAVGKLRKFIEYMTGPEGQASVKKAGHIPLADLKKKTE